MLSSADIAWLIVAPCTVAAVLIICVTVLRYNNPPRKQR